MTALDAPALLVGEGRSRGWPPPKGEFAGQISVRAGCLYGGDPVIGGGGVPIQVDQRKEGLALRAAGLAGRTSGRMPEACVLALGAGVGQSKQRRVGDGLARRRRGDHPIHGIDFQCAWAAAVGGDLILRGLAAEGDRLGSLLEQIDGRRAAQREGGGGRAALQLHRCAVEVDVDLQHLARLETRALAARPATSKNRNFSGKAKYSVSNR